MRTPAEAAAAQAELGGPVVVKIAAAIHKSDVGDGYDQGADRGHARPGVKVTALAPEIIVYELHRMPMPEGEEMITGVADLDQLDRRPCWDAAERRLSHTRMAAKLRPVLPRHPGSPRQFTPTGGTR